MKRQYLLTAILIFLPILGLTGQPGDETPIRIGATMSLTGAYSIQGIPANNGYLLCQKHVNESGGILGRSIEFTIYDDRSQTETAIELYEKLIVEEGVDLVIGPYGSTLTEAVAPVTERHRQVMISPLAATSSIWEQGREYLFMVLPPAELFLAGLIELADEHQFTRVAVLQEDKLFPKAAGAGAVQMAEEKGMEVPVYHTYPSGTRDFSDFLKKMERENIQVLGMAASSLGDFITLVKQMYEMNIEVDMFGTSGAVDEFQQALGEKAELTFGLSAWEPALPYPGIEEFVEGYQKEFGRSPSFHAAGAYGSCQLLIEAIERAESLDQDRLREELLRLETTTIFSNYSVDERGYQTANRGVFIQWQDGKKVVVWPPDLATGEVILQEGPSKR